MLGSASRAGCKLLRRSREARTLPVRAPKTVAKCGQHAVRHALCERAEEEEDEGYASDHVEEREDLRRQVSWIELEYGARRTVASERVAEAVVEAGPIAPYARRRTPQYSPWLHKSRRRPPQSTAPCTASCWRRVVAPQCLLSTLCLHRCHMPLCKPPTRTA